VAQHLTPKELQKLFGGTLSLGAELTALLHLSGCADCARRAGPLADAILAEGGEVIPLDLPATLDRAYDEAIERALATTRAALPRVQKEQARAAGIRGRIKRCERFRPKDFEGRTLIDELLRESFAVRYEAPGRMLELAGLALQMARIRRPGHSRLGRLLEEDLHAEAAAEYGNACRVNDRFDEAEAALAEALKLWEKGTGDLLLRARILDLRASVLTDRRRFPEAMALLSEVHGIYTELGESHLAGRALISQGIHAHEEGNARVGVRLLEEGLAQIDPAEDPKLVVAAQQAMVHALVDCGEHTRAAERLLRSGLRQALAGDSLSLVKLRALEAKIHAGLGRPEAAERGFAEARRGFLAQHQPFLAAVASVDLMLAQLQQGKTAAVRELAGDTVATFQELAIHREALWALSVVEDAAYCEPGDGPLAEALEKAARFLPRLERQPYLRFARDA
jgi:tetratricopeptide (TPR) repeat protein